MVIEEIFHGLGESFSYEIQNQSWAPIIIWLTCQCQHSTGMHQFKDLFCLLAPLRSGIWANFLLQHQSIFHRVKLDLPLTRYASTVCLCGN